MIAAHVGGVLANLGHDAIVATHTVDFGEPEIHLVIFTGPKRYVEPPYAVKNFPPVQHRVVRGNEIVLQQASVRIGRILKAMSGAHWTPQGVDPFEVSVNRAP